MEDLVLTEKLGRMIIADHPDLATHREAIKRLGEGIRKRVLSWGYGAHINWGLEHPATGTNLFHTSTDDDAKRIVDRRTSQNYYLSQYTPEKMAVFFDRLLAIDAQAVKDVVGDYVCSVYGKEVDGISVFGGYLYGDDRMMPQDLDLTVCVRESDIFENPVDLHVGSFCVVDKSFVRRPATDKLGLTIVGDRLVNDTVHNGFLMDAAVWESATGIPIYGNSLTSRPVPACAQIYKLIVQTVWGFKHLLFDDLDFLRTGITRLIENWYTLNYLSGQLGLPKIDPNSKADQLYDEMLRVDDHTALRDLFYASAMELRKPLTDVREAITEQAERRLERLLYEN